MKIFAVLLAVVLGVSFAAYADTYKWVDDKGVVNFTDDPANVPKKYQNKVKVIKSDQSKPDSGSVSPVPAPPSAPAMQAETSSPADLYGGHDESWWRSRYGGLRGEIRDLQDGLPAKREELQELRRELAVRTYARNREAYQAKLAEIQQDEARIGELTSRLAELDAEAARAGVPFGWRQ